MSDDSEWHFIVSILVLESTQVEGRSFLGRDVGASDRYI